MTAHRAKPIIALDADGVLLDYHHSYRSAWHRAFGELPALRDPLAYWPLDRWEVRRLTGGELDHFRAFFDADFWSTVPAIHGAVDACHMLDQAGFELVCVSALPASFQPARLKNLQDAGFPITRVVATGNEAGDVSPKATALDALSPVAFVDDYLPYLRGIPASIHAALVLREPNGSPNNGADMNQAHSTHADLVEFTGWWLTKHRERQASTS